jgi:hypothetical protein
MIIYLSDNNFILLIHKLFPHHYHLLIYFNWYLDAKMSYRIQDVDSLRECFIAAEINFSFWPATLC